MKSDGLRVAIFAPMHREALTKKVNLWLEQYPTEIYQVNQELVGGDTSGRYEILMTIWFKPIPGETPEEDIE